MRTTNGTNTYACVVFVAHTRDCNYVTLLGPSWTTIATDVKDGTRWADVYLKVTRRYRAGSVEVEVLTAVRCARTWSASGTPSSA